MKNYNIFFNIGIIIITFLIQVLMINLYFIQNIIFELFKIFKLIEWTLRILRLLCS